MFGASISVIILFPLQDVDHFIGLRLGMKGDFDLEKSVAVPFFLGMAGIFASFLLMTYVSNQTQIMTVYHKKAWQLFGQNCVLKLCALATRIEKLALTQMYLNPACIFSLRCS